jgi:hypothetical protein
MFLSSERTNHPGIIESSMNSIWENNQQNPKIRLALVDSKFPTE